VEINLNILHFYSQGCVQLVLIWDKKIVVDPVDTFTFTDVCSESFCSLRRWSFKRQKEARKLVSVWKEFVTEGRLRMF